MYDTAWSMPAPAALTDALPASTPATEAAISVLIWVAAAAERCASAHFAQQIGLERDGVHYPDNLGNLARTGLDLVHRLHRLLHRAAAAGGEQQQLGSAPQFVQHGRSWCLVGMIDVQA